MHFYKDFNNALLLLLKRLSSRLAVVDLEATGNFPGLRALSNQFTSVKLTSFLTCLLNLSKYHNNHPPRRSFDRGFETFKVAIMEKYPHMEKKNFFQF